MQTDDRLLTPDEVADFLAVPRQTLYKWRLRSEGPPALRIGKHLRYRQSDIDGWLTTRYAPDAR